MAEADTTPGSSSGSNAVEGVTFFNVSFDVPARIARKALTIERGEEGSDGQQPAPKVSVEKWTSVAVECFAIGQKEHVDALSLVNGPSACSGGQQSVTSWAPRPANCAFDAEGTPKLNVWYKFRCGYQAGSKLKACPNNEMRLGFQWDELYDAVDAADDAPVKCYIQRISSCEHAGNLPASQRSITARRVNQNSILDRASIGTATAGGLSSGNLQARHLASIGEDVMVTGNVSLINADPATSRKQTHRANKALMVRDETDSRGDFIAAAKEVNLTSPIWHQTKHGGLPIKGTIFDLEDGGFMLTSRDAMQQRRDFLGEGKIEGLDFTRNMCMSHDGSSFDTCYLTIASGESAPVLIHCEIHLPAGTSGSLYRALHKRDEIERYAFGEVSIARFECTDAGLVERMASAKLHHGCSHGELISRVQRHILEGNLDDLPRPVPVEDLYHGLQKPTGYSIQLFCFHMGN
jgi:hypothetical protein